ncbi:MAG: adenylate/guanylate cyclase domain-containing protein [Pseudomonadota bacterium]
MATDVVESALSYAPRAEAQVAMLFTDIEGSTVLLQHLGEGFDALLLRHHTLLREAIAKCGGTEVSSVGDAFFATFRTTADAVEAALDGQRLLQAENWPDEIMVRVRMGVHFGATRLVGDDLTGIDVHRAARIANAARGGQLILSRDAVDTLDNKSLAAGVTVRALGRHRLKDLRFPETLFDIVAPGLMAVFGPVRSLSEQPTNLVMAAHPLVGREADLEHIETLLEDPSRRVITLTGTGGVGKSSLARAAAEAAMPRFHDGVFLVDLGGLNDIELVFPTVALTLGVHDFPGRPVLEDIAASIGTGEQLLVLDTFEHLVDASADLTTLTEACPNLRLIVTSRAALGLRTEATHEVAPLALPDADGTLEEIKANASVQVYVDRVHEFDPDFVLTPETAPTVARICIRLEGVPLAIELGAARAKTLGPQRLLDRLTERLGVLKGGRRDAASRHKTLTAAIDWSDDLLTEEQRAVFQSLSVFRGGFGIEDAEEVLDGIHTQDVDVLDAIESLLDKSLLLRRSENGEPRFGMYDMIREYARDALDKTGKRAAVRDAHLAQFVRVSETCGAQALLAAQRASVTQLESEADNIRAALDWALETRNLADMSRIVYALHWYWISQAQFTEALTWVQKSTALADALGQDDVWTARLREAACSVCMGAGDYLGGLPHGEASKRIYDALGDADGAARIDLTRSICATVAGQIEDPSPVLMASIERFRGVDNYSTALGLILLGEGARMAEMLEPAEGCYREALDLLALDNNTYWPGHLKQNIAHFRLKDKNWVEAAELLADAYDQAEDYDFPMISNLCVAGFAGVALYQGDAQKAALILGAVALNLEKIGVVFEPTDKADIDSYAEGARAVLGEAAYAIAAAEGAARPWSEVRALARACADV